MVHFLKKVHSIVHSVNAFLTAKSHAETGASDADDDE